MNFARMKRERYAGVGSYSDYVKNFDDFFGPKLSRKEQVYKSDPNRSLV